MGIEHMGMGGKGNVKSHSRSSLLQFDVLTTLSLTILAYLHAFAAVASEICEIPKNSLKIQTYEV